MEKSSFFEGLINILNIVLNKNVQIKLYSLYKNENDFFVKNTILTQKIRTKTCRKSIKKQKYLILKPY